MLKIPCLIKANSLCNYAKQINSLDKAVLTQYSKGLNYNWFQK